MDKIAEEMNANKELVHFIVQNESGYYNEAVGDTKFNCKFKSSPHYGKPVYARGILQITRCYHPEVSDEEAFDPYFSLRWAIPLIMNKRTCLREYTTCRMYYARYSMIPLARK